MKDKLDKIIFLLYNSTMSHIDSESKIILKSNLLPSPGEFFLLKLKNRPTTVFAANDLSAAGIYKALFAANLKIPDDIVVASHDDIDIVSLLTPELTTMRQPKYSMGEKAVTVLLKMINNEETKIKDQILKTNLIIRESV